MLRNIMENGGVKLRLYAAAYPGGLIKLSLYRYCGY